MKYITKMFPAVKYTNEEIYGQIKKQKKRIEWLISEENKRREAWKAMIATEYYNLECLQKLYKLNDEVKALYNSVKINKNEEIWIKDIATSEIRTVHNPLISSCIPQMLINLVQTNVFKNSSFLLGVGYKDGDNQCCISETSFVKESPVDTAHRGVIEETGLVIDVIKLLYMGSTKTVYNVEMNHYVININDCKALSFANVTNMIHTNKKENRYVKSIVYIHGTFNDITKLISEINMNSLKNEDKIACLTVIPIKVAYSWAKHRWENFPDRNEHDFFTFNHADIN